MNKNIVFAFVLLVLCCGSLYSQSVPGQVLGIYGGSRSDHGGIIVKAPAGGFLLLGETESFGNGRFDYVDIIAIRVDSEGKIVWQKTFGGQGDEYIMDAIRTADNHYIILIPSYSFEQIKTAWVIKIDDSGNVIWQKALNFGFASALYTLTEEMADGTFVVAGSWYDNSIYSYPSLLKLDTNGNVLWRKKVSGNGLILTIVALDDGGIFAGSSDSIYRFDKDGNLIWCRKIYDFDGSTDFFMNDVKKADSGGFIVATDRERQGISYSYPEVLRFSDDGQLLWAKRLANHPMSPRQIMKQGNGECLMAAGWHGGTFFSFNEDGTMAKAGTSYRIPFNHGPGMGDTGKVATFAEDGTVAFVGFAQNVGNYIGKSDEIILIKTGMDNQISGGCSWMENLELEWEDVEIPVENLSFEVQDFEVDCVDTTSYGFVNPSYATGLNTFCPVIYSVEKMQNPFKLKISGDNLFIGPYIDNSDAEVTIDGVPVPKTTVKDVYTIIAKKGNALKKMLPKGIPVCIKVTDKEEPNFQSDCFTFTR